MFAQLVNCAYFPNSSPRRTANRAAVEVFSDHCSLFSDFVANDARFWHAALREWAFSTNRDDHKVCVVWAYRYYVVRNALYLAKSVGKICVTDLRLILLVI